MLSHRKVSILLGCIGVGMYISAMLEDIKRAYSTKNKPNTTPSASNTAKKQPPLIASGAYLFCRHPKYFGQLLTCCSISLYLFTNRSNFGSFLKPRLQSILGNFYDNLPIPLQLSSNYSQRHLSRLIISVHIIPNVINFFFCHFYLIPKQENILASLYKTKFELYKQKIPKWISLFHCIKILGNISKASLYTFFEIMAFSICQISIKLDLDIWDKMFQYMTKDDEHTYDTPICNLNQIKHLIPMHWTRAFKFSCL